MHTGPIPVLTSTIFSIAWTRSDTWFEAAGSVVQSLVSNLGKPIDLLGAERNGAGLLGEPSGARLDPGHDQIGTYPLRAPLSPPDFPRIETPHSGTARHAQMPALLGTTGNPSQHSCLARKSPGLALPGQVSWRIDLGG